MNTRGKHLLAVAVLSAAPLAVAVPAHAMAGPQTECLRAPCRSTVTAVETIGRFIRGYEARGWTCVHVTRHEWACANLRAGSSAASRWH